MTAPLLTARTREGAAKLALAASSVAHVASGYARSLCSFESGFSRLASAIGKERDL
jgi:hypothetical protein